MLHSKPHMDAFAEVSILHQSTPHYSKNWIEQSLNSMKPANAELTESMFNSYQMIKAELNNTYVKLGLDIEFMIVGGFLNQTPTAHNHTIDILIINNGFFENSAYKNQEKVFLQELVALRNFTYKHLISNYPEVKIDDSRPLSIDFTLQSIPHAINLYFGLWQCTTPPNTSGYFSDSKTVNLLNFHTLNTQCCNPEKALNNLSCKNEQTNGNARNLIRLLKEIKAKSRKKNHLSGYKIESLVYSMSVDSLLKTANQTLALLIECSLHIKKMIDDPLHKNYILTADGFIAFDEHDNANEIEQLSNLKDEVNTLLKQIVLDTK